MGGQGSRVKLDASWQQLIGDQFDEPYMRKLSAFLRAEKSAGKRIYPPGGEMFAALNATPVDQVSVVIIGQDPYHGAGQAHGLCFSVRPGVQVPPSLLNIFTEISADIECEVDRNAGCLSGWARQGVLLLNAVLSVEHGRAASHQGKGWERFTDVIVERLNSEREGLVFMLWGSYAQKKGAVLDTQRHCVLRAPHPSPLSAHRGFLGCRHFSQANAYLRGRGVAPVDWSATG